MSNRPDSLLSYLVVFENLKTEENEAIVNEKMTVQQIREYKKEHHTMQS